MTIDHPAHRPFVMARILGLPMLALLVLLAVGAGFKPGPAGQTASPVGATSGQVATAQPSGRQS